MALKSTLFAGNARLEAIAAGGTSMKAFVPDDRTAVQKIQRALSNKYGAMPKSWPTAPAGEPDGGFGSETQSYVIRFQKEVFPGQATEWDGVVGKKTIEKLDGDSAATGGSTGPGATPAPPLPPPPPPPGPPVATTVESSSASGPLVDRVKNLLDRAKARQLQAWKIATWARFAVIAPPSNNFNQKCLALVDRCFKIKSGSAADQIGDINRIINTYQTGMIYTAMEIDEKSSGGSGSWLNQSATILYARGGGLDTANAITMGQWNGQKNTTHGPLGIIFAQDKCNGQSEDWLLDAMTHEFAHWSGNPLDRGYGNDAFTLPRDVAVRNASNYAWFAGISETGMDNWPTGSYPS